MSAPAEPIHSFDQLVAHFQSGNKPAAQHRIGLEHEKIAVLPDGSAPSHEVIARIIGRFVETGWSPILETDQLIGATHPEFGSFTLEPGGQLEHSGNPFLSVLDATWDNDDHLDQLVEAAAIDRVRLLATGFRPFGPVDVIPWMPKGRYVVMRDYLPRYGKRAYDMMKRTATVQANVDYVDEADAMEKLRLGHGISPLVTALFAASPLADGKNTGQQSYRASAWLETDPARCGLLPFLFSDHAGFRDYAEWAFDVPMFFLYREGRYHSLAGEGFTFRRFMAEGKNGERASLDDWELHLSTLFPEVRLKRYIEVRQADASTREMVRALPALWRGIMASSDSRTAAYALVKDLTWDERLALQHEVPRTGLRSSSLNGRSFLASCKQLVEIARAGLATVEPAAQTLLQPLEEIAATGRTVADRIIQAHSQAAGDVAKLIESMAL